MSWLTHPLLAERGAAHGFGTRACAPPERLLRPRQVHGTRVVVVPSGTAAPGDPGAADALVSARASLPIGVVTADCLPILVATSAGPVAAVHAGWRGLAGGVIGEAMAALAALAQGGLADATAVIGPRVGRGCYEVDAPVVDALALRFSDALAGALAPTRPGHWQLDLGALAHADLVRAGLAPARIAALDACTACDPERFHSHRRDGARAGRLVHWIAAPADACAGLAPAALDTRIRPE